MRLDQIAALMNNKARSNRQWSKAVTGVMKARQNQQQGQCKGRGRRQTEREDITRQAGSRRQAANGQSHVGSPGKQNTGETLRMSAGAKQDFATCVGKCAAYMWVSE